MKNNMIKKFEVIEDNGGGLTLAVFGAPGIIEYIHTGYEYIPGQLSEDLKALQDGSDPTADWDGNADDPQAFYDNIVSYEYGWEVVADNYGIYPDKMGRAASIEFSHTTSGDGLQQKALFESMSDDFMADHLEYSDLLIGETEKDESGEWVSYAEDDTHIYLLHDTGNGNIVLDYIGTK